MVPVLLDARIVRRVKRVELLVADVVMERRRPHCGGGERQRSDGDVAAQRGGAVAADLEGVGGVEGCGVAGHIGVVGDGRDGAGRLGERG